MTKRMRKSDDIKEYLFSLEPERETLVRGKLMYEATTTPQKISDDTGIPLSSVYRFLKLNKNKNGIQFYKYEKVVVSWEAYDTINQI